MKILRIMAIFFLMHGLLMSYEFIGEYLSGHNAVGWSVAEDDEDGYYVILTGECLDYGDYYCDSYNYGILRVGKYGEEIDYRVIYHYEYTRGKGKERQKRNRGSRKLRGIWKDRSEDGGGKIWRLRDGRYAVVVDDIYYSDDFGYYGYPHVMLLDRDLNIIWSKDIYADIDASTEPGGIKETSDGDLIMYYTSYPYCTEGVTIKMRVEDGVEDWRINGSNDIEEVGGGYIRCRMSHIGLIDSNGDSIWEKVYETESGNDPYRTLVLASIERGIGGGYIAAGRYEMNPDTFIGYIVKVDDSGRVEWQREYFGWLHVNGIFRDGDGYVVGWRPLGTAARITRIDSTGNIVWDRTYLDDVWTYYMYEIKPTSDGGYIMVGKSKFKQDLSIERVSVIKTDSMGLVDGVDWETDTPKVEMPERGMDYVVRSLYELRDLIFRDRLIKIYTVTGQEIRSRDLSELNRGMYLYRRSGGKEGKLLIIRK